MFKKRPLIRAIFIFLISWILILVFLMVVYFGWLRDWQLTWGATEDEASRYMAGDEFIDRPDFNATRAVEIKASPDQVWPWIVQMGRGRGGYYAFDKLDNMGQPSAIRIIPEYQDLKVSDDIQHFLKVAEINHEESMLWIFDKRAGGWGNATWSWGLYETENGNTRLVTRLRQKYITDSPLVMLMYGFQEVTEIFMMRTCLLGIKRRVEEYNKKDESKKVPTKTVSE